MRDQVRTIRIGCHHLRVPALFASYRLGDCPTSGLKDFPWNLTQTEALLINAYDFTRPKYAAWLNNGWNPSAYLKFPKKPLLIDSGAYYFRKHPEIDVTPAEVLEIQLRSKADVAVALDHPFTPDAADKPKRITTTIKNTDVLLRLLTQKQGATGIDFMPVIHGHTRRSILGCIQRLRSLADKYEVPVLDHVGIGSLAPLAQRGNAQLAVDVIRTVRRELPTSQIHCFSMGSALLMLLAFRAGADSVDSQSWIVSAGFKLAQLPGHYVVRMGKREYSSGQKFSGAMRRFASRLETLAKNESFSVRDWHTGKELEITSKDVRKQYVRSLVDEDSNENVHNRACHNLWVFNFEVQQYRAAAMAGKLDDFVNNRVTGTRYEAANAALTEELKKDSRATRQRDRRRTPMSNNAIVKSLRQ